jgi:hypothetical protein
VQLGFPAQSEIENQILAKSPTVLKIEIKLRVSRLVDPTRTGRRKLFPSEIKACDTVLTLPSWSLMVFCSRVKSVALILVAPAVGRLKLRTRTIAESDDWFDRRSGD